MAGALQVLSLYIPIGRGRGLKSPKVWVRVPVEALLGTPSVVLTGQAAGYSPKMAKGIDGSLPGFGLITEGLLEWFESTSRGVITLITGIITGIIVGCFFYYVFTR